MSTPKNKKTMKYNSIPQRTEAPKPYAVRHSHSIKGAHFSRSRPATHHRMEGAGNKLYNARTPKA